MARWLVVFLALSVLAVPHLTAQQTTGTVTGIVSSEDGLPLPAASLVVRDPATGFQRSTTTNTLGAYRVAGLPPGSYVVTASREGFRSIENAVIVPLGGTARRELELPGGVFSGTLEINEELPLLDPGSSTSEHHLDTDLLDRLLPLVHDTTQLAFLVPGTVVADSAFSPSNREVKTEQTGCTFCGWGTPGQNLLSFSGASVAENLYVVDGLNITNFSQSLGSSFIPLAFVDQIQVKTGGLTAEFGRSTGGVVNMVTKSGSNSLHGDLHLWWAPESLQELPPDTLTRQHQAESRESVETTAWLGGPLLRDRLFFFLFLRHLDNDSTESFDAAREANIYEFPARVYHYRESSSYWGLKLDYDPSAGHRLSATYLSDKVDLDKTRHSIDLDNGELVDPIGGSIHRGGGNLMLRYSGMFGERLVLSAQAGRNEFDRYNRSEIDACPVAYSGPQQLYPEPGMGCWVLRELGSWSDRRDTARVDADWFLGRHALRAGADFEHNVSKVALRPSGNAVYRYYYNIVTWPDLPWDTRLAQIYEYEGRGDVEADSRAAYVLDSWSPTPSLTCNLGLRWERYEHRNAADERFLKTRDTFSPRVGFAWDLTDRGRSKLHASLGRYRLPYPTNYIAAVGLAWRERVRTFVVDGEILPDGTPEGLGELLADNQLSNGSVWDPRNVSASNVKPMSQRELVVGYRHSVGASWTLGVRAVGRELEESIDDFDIAQGLWETYGVCNPATFCENYRVGNLGRDFAGWFDLDGDGELESILLSAESLGYPEPERKYYAVELSAERRFTESWMLFASYTWSHSYGNYEGLVNSDLGHPNSGFSPTYDRPTYLEYANGDLPNDRRHAVKIHGAYTWRNGLQLGGNLYWSTGRPVNSLGYHPTDPWLPFAFYTSGLPTPRGSMGRTEILWSLDLTAAYHWRWGGAELDARVDVFNLFDNQAVTEVEEQGEYRDRITPTSILPNPDWGLTTAYQAPRTIRLGVGVSF